ncbi:hypothetical protein ACIP98_04130 [Streptomyces sp. NPDC088354]|uniref:hypothetical protein n=1 Tax=Streptomyces sp. NPDC088354 TaxID=3365856 RepID=UPI00380FCB6A
MADDITPPPPKRHAPPSDWPGRLIAAAFVITGIFRMSSEQHMTWSDKALVLAGCVALGSAGLQEVRRAVRHRRTRGHTT